MYTYPVEKYAPPRLSLSWNEINQHIIFTVLHHVVKVATAVDFKRLELLSGRAYEAEICAILLLLRCPFA